MIATPFRASVSGTPQAISIAPPGPGRSGPAAAAGNAGVGRASRGFIATMIAWASVETALAGPMNLLAHALAAAPDAELMLGSLIGDFVRGRIDPSLPPAIRAGVALHRAVDTFTDAHAEI